MSASSSDNDKTVVLGGSAEAAAPAPATTAELDSHNALPLGTRLGEFEIVGLVGEGGFGIVYLTQDHSLERRVALKEYMPASLASRKGDTSVAVRSERHRETFEIGRRSFVNEARLLAQFDHPALVKVYRFWEANGTAYMVMPFYEGRTLRDTLFSRGAAPDEAWIRKIVAPVMDALEIIHAESCYHRDIAPDNIMLLRDERPVLLDFGAARRVIGDMTQALTVILKPGYAPIEQYAEMPGMKQGPWTDIYALAAVVYFMITGKTPPPSVGRMMQDSFEPLARLAAGRYSPGFLQGVDACLAVRAEDRPQAVAEMRKALAWDQAGPAVAASASATRATAAAPPKTAARPQSGQGETPQGESASGSKGLVIAAGALVALAAIAGGAYFMMKPAAVPPPGAGQSAAAPPPMAETSPAAAAPTVPTTTASASVPAVETPAVESGEKPVAARGPIPLQDAVKELLAAASPDISVRVEKLKERLVIGKDPLSLTLRSGVPGYAYLLLWDKATGRFAQVFPNELDRNNAIEPARPLVLPRSGWAYKADAPAGDWELVALVSEARRDFSPLGLQVKDGIASAPVNTLEETLGKLGAARLAGDAQCKAGAECPAKFGALSFSVSEVEAPTNASRERPDATKPPRAEKASGGKGSEQGSGTEAEREYMKKLNKDLDQLLK
ncbi:protein kinase [Niveibacterium sp. SC-1]|uniref:serine/threonine protein kinase n=1 Tax=Niveibacterium sp. SC-1 TaxID=3135646 RepID=UPI00311D9714